VDSVTPDPLTEHFCLGHMGNRLFFQMADATSETDNAFTYYFEQTGGMINGNFLLSYRILEGWNYIVYEFSKGKDNTMCAHAFSISDKDCDS
jgi:hypothetical protein